MNYNGEPIENDALRDKVNEMLTAMRQDFILARLVPSCALCKKYFTGLGDEDKVRHTGTCARGRLLSADERWAW